VAPVSGPTNFRGLELPAPPCEKKAPLTAQTSRLVCVRLSFALRTFELRFTKADTLCTKLQGWQQAADQARQRRSRTGRAKCEGQRDPLWCRDRRS
jgi:hypothetical protein